MLLTVLKNICFKLMNNIYTKTTKILRKIIKIKLVNNVKDCKKICKETKFCFTEDI